MGRTDVHFTEDAHLFQYFSGFFHHRKVAVAAPKIRTVLLFHGLDDSRCNCFMLQVELLGAPVKPERRLHKVRQDREQVLIGRPGATVFEQV